MNGWLVIGIVCSCMALVAVPGIIWLTIRAVKLRREVINLRQELASQDAVSEPNDCLICDLYRC